MMKRLCIPLLLVCSLVQALAARTDSDTKRHQAYIDLMHTHPQTIGKPGQACEGEIELVLDIPSIQSIEKKQYAQLIRQGHSAEVAQKASQAGIIEEGLYWNWVRDPIRTDKGEGVYGRIILTKTMEVADAFSSPGAAVLPILKDGSIVLNLSFRHATRSWELEIPAGMREYGESPQDAAHESCLKKLATLLQNSLIWVTQQRILLLLMTLFLSTAPLLKTKKPRCQTTLKPLLRHFTLPLAQIEQGFKDGMLRIPVGNKIIEAHVRQSLLAFALYQAQLRGFLHKP